MSFAQSSRTSHWIHMPMTALLKCRINCIKPSQGKYRYFKWVFKFIRHRTLASVGTHDYDTIQGPFAYTALNPEEINFVPLNQSRSVNGKEIMEFYGHDLKLKQYLSILEASPLYPVILDNKSTVCSLPPLINSDHSKISVNTKNIFIEVTATDAIKGEMLLKTLIGSYSLYCSKKYS